MKLCGESIIKVQKTDYIYFSETFCLYAVL